MTPKEKAKELLEKFIPLTMKWDSENGWQKDESDAADCVLIAVDEIIKSNPIIPLQFMLESESLDAANEYWQQVKEEITNL